MLTYKFSWLAAAVFAASVAGSTVPAMAAVAPVNSPNALQTAVGPAQKAPKAHAFLFAGQGGSERVGASGLMRNGLLPVPPTYG